MTCLLFHLKFDPLDLFIVLAIFNVRELLLGAFQEMCFFLDGLELFYAATYVLRGESRSRSRSRGEEAPFRCLSRG
jgi:hypothetical protein